MIADLGIVLLRSTRISLLSELPRETKTWGGETFVVGELYHKYSELENVLLQIFPVGQFVTQLLPDSWREPELDYVGIGGDGKIDYVKWIDFECQPDVWHPFEIGLKSLLSKAGKCALILVPDDESVEMIGTVELEVIPQILRDHLLNVGRSPGFVALLK